MNCQWQSCLRLLDTTLEKDGMMDSEDKFVLKIVGGIVLGVGALFTAWCSFQIIPPGHRGVSVTLGKVDSVVVKEGFAFKKPFIESINTVNIQQCKMDGDASCFSSDLQTVMVHFAVMTRTPENQVVGIFQNYAGDPYWCLVEPRLQEALKQVTAKYSADNLVKSREAIREAALKTVRDAVGFTIEIVDLNISNIDLSDQLEKAIEQKMVKEQEALAMSYQLDKANKEAQITIVNAKAEAESVKIKGEALAVSSKVIELEIVKRWDGKAPQTVVVGSNSSGASIILPVGGK